MFENFKFWIHVFSISIQISLVEKFKSFGHFSKLVIPQHKPILNMKKDDLSSRIYCLKKQQQSILEQGTVVFA